MFPDDIWAEIIGFINAMKVLGRYAHLSAFFTFFCSPCSKLASGPLWWPEENARIQTLPIYLRKLSLSSISFRSDIWRGLRRLVLLAGIPNEANMRILKNSASNLRSLSLSCKPASPELLGFISENCPALRSLSVHLKQCDTLKYDNQIIANVVRRLRTLHLSLELPWVDFRRGLQPPRNSFLSDLSRAIGDSPQLEVLELDLNCGCDAIGQILSCFPNLRRVKLPSEARLAELSNLSNHRELERVEMGQDFFIRKTSKESRLVPREIEALQVRARTTVVEVHNTLNAAATLKHNIVFHGATVLNYAILDPRNADSFVASLPMNGVPFGVATVVASFGRRCGDVPKLVRLIRSPKCSKFLPTLREVFRKLNPVDLMGALLKLDLDFISNVSELSDDIATLLPVLKLWLSRYLKVGHPKANFLWFLPHLTKEKVSLLRRHGILHLDNVLIERNSEGLSLACIAETADQVELLHSALGPELFTLLQVSPLQRNQNIAEFPLVYLWGELQDNAAAAVMKLIEPTEYPQNLLQSCLSGASVSRVTTALRCAVLSKSLSWMRFILDTADLCALGTACLSHSLWTICLHPTHRTDESHKEFDPPTIDKTPISPLLQLFIERIKQENLTVQIFGGACCAFDHLSTISDECSGKLVNMAVVIAEFEQDAVDQFRSIAKEQSFGSICWCKVEIEWLFTFTRVKPVLQYGSKLISAMKKFCEIVAQETFLTADPDADQNELLDFKSPSALFLNKCYDRIRIIHAPQICINMCSWMLTQEFSIVESPDRRAARRAHLLSALRRLTPHFIAALADVFAVCVPFLSSHEILTKDVHGRDLIENVQLTSSPRSKDILRMLEDACAGNTRRV